MLHCFKKYLLHSTKVIKYYLTCLSRGGSKNFES